jgi:hypothetical protein
MDPEDQSVAPGQEPMQSSAQSLVGPETHLTPEAAEVPADPPASETLPPVSAPASPNAGMQQLKDGLAKAMACLDIEPLRELPSGDRALPEWERAVVATAIEEIAPAVATMLTVAIERRMPWWSSSE